MSEPGPGAVYEIFRNRYLNMAEREIIAQMPRIDFQDSVLVTAGNSRNSGILLSDVSALRKLDNSDLTPYTLLSVDGVLFVEKGSLSAQLWEMAIKSQVSKGDRMSTSSLPTKRSEYLEIERKNFEKTPE